MGLVLDPASLGVVHVVDAVAAVAALVLEPALPVVVPAVDAAAAVAAVEEGEEPADAHELEVAEVELPVGVELVEQVVAAQGAGQADQTSSSDLPTAVSLPNCVHDDMGDSVGISRGLGS